MMETLLETSPVVYLYKVLIGQTYTNRLIRKSLEKHQLNLSFSVPLLGFGWIRVQVNNITFISCLHPALRELTAKALLHGQNPLDDYRSSDHQGGSISFPIVPPSRHHDKRLAICTDGLYPMIALLGYKTLSTAMSTSCTESGDQAQHHKRRWRAKVQHFTLKTGKHVAVDRLVVSVVCVVCSLDSRKRRIPRAGSYDILQFLCCIIWLCSQSL